MPDIYKLTYFPMKGFGEPIRYMLAYLDAPFEDVRIQPDQWKSIKPTTPFGKVPTLEVNGKTVSQSVAITRYLGRKAGLGGKDEWEDLQIDMTVESVIDFLLAGSNAFHERNEETKAKKQETLLNETLPQYVERLDKRLAENNGYIANGKLSWGDIYIVAVIDTINIFLKLDITDKSSNLKALYNKVNNLPKIKSWINKRPQDRLPNAN